MAEHVSTAIVVGGGPAGLIAAETLATNGVRVTVYDHMRSVGRKLLLAGRAGLNLTHSESADRFVGRYDAPEWMAPILAEFNQDDLRAWAESLGEPTFVGSSGRVFPESFRATPLLRAWLRRLGDLGVAFETQQRWVGWADDGSVRFAGPDGVDQVVHADAVILAMGGASWPRVGSDGGWVSTFRADGIDVASMVPSNAGVIVDWTKGYVDRFEGVPLKNISVRVAGEPVRGDAIVTRRGLEGAPIYDANRELRSALDAGVATIIINLHPDLTTDRLQARLGQRRPKDSTSTWLRRSVGLSPVAIGLLREATGNLLPGGAGAMAALVHAVPVAVSGLTPIDRAISSAGGVARHELDDSLMLVRRPGTFVAGEMIDWDAPTGGYLLQASFATGVRAARGVLAMAR